MTAYLKTLNVELDNRTIIFHHNSGLIFQFHMFQTNIEVYLSECYQCPLDCNKNIEFFLGKSSIEINGANELTFEDLLLLANIREISQDNLPVESATLKDKLRNKIHSMNFGLIGFDLVGKTTLFELIPGKQKKVTELIHSYVKEILSFFPLQVKIYDYGTPIMENLVNNAPAPMLLDKLRHFYLYIVVTDSSPQNVMATKDKILPKIKKASPYAAIIIIANKQDLPNRLSTALIEKIIGENTYPFSAINSDAKDNFIKLLNEIILLRLEQKQEYYCPFLKEKSIK